MMTTATLERPNAQDTQIEHVEVKVIDTDVHVEPRSFDELIPYLEAPWRDMPNLIDSVPFSRSTYKTLDGGGRKDAYPSIGDICSDPDFVGRQMFGYDPTDYAILLPG